MWLVARMRISLWSGVRTRLMLTPFQEGDFAALLIRNRQGVLEFGIAIAKLVASSLFGFYPLPSGSFLA